MRIGGGGGGEVLKIRMIIMSELDATEKV